jgi:hypothetical protein
MLAGRLHYVDTERTEILLQQSAAVARGLNALINAVTLKPQSSKNSVPPTNN